MKKFAIFLVSLVSIVYLNSEIANSATLYPNLDFLSNTSSMRSFSMGGTRITDISSESALFNPATLAFYHSDKNFSISFPAHAGNGSGRTTNVWEGTGRANSTGYAETAEGEDFLSGFDTPDSSGLTGSEKYQIAQNHPLRMPKTWGVSFGKVFGDKQRATSNTNRIFTIAAGYFEVKNARGNEYGEIARVFTASLALDIGAKIGIGINRKIVNHLGNTESYSFESNVAWVNSAILDTKEKLNMTDFGLFAEFPLFGSSKSNFSFFGLFPDNYSISFVPSFAFSSLNNGAKITIPTIINEATLGSFAPSLVQYNIPTAQVNIMGVSTKLSLSQNNKNFFTLVTSFERLKVWTNYRARIENYIGGEIGIINSFYLRYGSANGYSRFGYGLDLRGILDHFKSNKTEFSDGNFYDYLLKNMNLEIDMAVHESFSNYLMKITLSL